MMQSDTTVDLDLTIVIPALNEAGNIGESVRRCRQTVEKIGLNYEIIVVDGGSSDETVEEARAAGARPIGQKGKEYGGALRSGLSHARGEYVQTLDSDLSHEPEVIERLWESREKADIVIASRYVEGGNADMVVLRRILSRVLNVILTAALREDIVEANLRAAARGKPGGVYNIGGGSRIAMNEILKKIETILGRPLKIDRQESQKGDMRHTFADTTRARADLGFDPKTKLDEGLTAEAHWIENSLPLRV